MPASEKMSSQMLPLSMMELREETGKQLCLQTGVVDSSTRQKCWGWRKNPARWFWRWNQCVVKLQLSWSELSCHPPGLGSSFLLPHLSSASCFPVATLCVVCSRSPGRLSGWQQGHELKSLEVPFVGQLIFKIHVKPLWNWTHHAEACLVTVKCSGWNLALLKPLQTLIDGAGPGSLLVLQVVPQLRKKPPFLFFFFF